MNDLRCVSSLLIPFISKIFYLDILFETRNPGLGCLGYHQKCRMCHSDVAVFSHRTVPRALPQLSETKHSEQWDFTLLGKKKKQTKTQNCFKKYKKKEKPYLVFTPADMVWFAVVVPLWPWSHRLICGAVIGLAKRRWTAHHTLNLTGTQKFCFCSENLH